jgi:two-component system, NarL family, invasion response regulator UvrY
MMKVLLVDDHAVVRHGLKQLLADSLEGIAVGEAGTGGEAVSMCGAETWDVVVLDISLPDQSGLDVLAHIKAERPNTRVLMLTMHAEEQYAIRVLKAGADGYLTKASALDQLVEAVRRVAGGRKYLSQTLQERLVLADLIEPSQLPHETLTDREFQIMRLIAKGHALTTIARSLSLSVKTVSTHRSRLLRKMHMTSNAELVEYAVRNSLVSVGLQKFL